MLTSGTIKAPLYCTQSSQTFVSLFDLPTILEFTCQMGILWSVFVQHTSQSVWNLFLTRWKKEDESGGVKFTKYYRSSHTRANCKCELVSSPCVNGTSLLGTIYRLIRPASGAAMRVTSLSCQAAAPLLASRDTKDKRPRADDGIERPPPPPRTHLPCSSSIPIPGAAFPFPASLAAVSLASSGARPGASVGTPRIDR